MSFLSDTFFELSESHRILAADKLAETTAKIAIENFEWRYITLLFFNSSFLHGVNKFLKFYDKSVMISRGGLDTPRNAEVTRQYVIFVTDVKRITNVLDWMKPYNFDNTGKYIFICESEDCDESQAVKTFWYNKITNVVFLKHFEEQVSGYIYFFSADNCAMSDPVKIDMDFCLRNTTKCNLYPEKFSNFFKCPLIASAFPQPPYMMNLDGKRPIGVDGSLLYILSGALNATLKTMTPSKGDGWGALKDGTWLGSLGDVYYDLANISITSAALTLNRFSSFQLSHIYNFVIIGWVCNPTELESASLKLLHPFNMLTHMAVTMTFTLVILCSILLGSKLWKRLKKRFRVISGKKNNVVLYSWMICMGLATPKLPKNPALLYVVFIWIWYTFLVRTMYQASLINSLKTNVYVKNVDTVEEMIQNKYKFGGGFALKDYYINYPEVYDQFIGMNFSELRRIAQKITKGEKLAIAVNLEAAASLYFTEGEQFHVLSQRIVVSPTAIFFKKFSPIAESVNWNLLKLVEAGITDKLYRIYITARKERSSSSKDQEPMTLVHFTGCYAILFAGWSISVLLFICEIICYAYKNK